jgi:hypothetical protein
VLATLADGQTIELFSFCADERSFATAEQVHWLSLVLDACVQFCTARFARDLYHRLGRGYSRRGGRVRRCVSLLSGARTSHFGLARSG